MKVTTVKDNSGTWMFLLTAILMLRISSYFMISDSVEITQLYKFGIRCGLTFIAGILYLRYRNSTAGFTDKNWLPIIAYGAYLLFGTASLLWSSGLGASALQLAMDIETFVFVFFFMQLVFALGQNGKSVQMPALLSSSIFFTGVLFAAGLYFYPEVFYRLTHGGEVSRLGGFIINPNELGMLLVIGVTAFLYDFFRNEKLRIRNLLAISFLIWLLVLTGSRSSFTALILVITVYALTRPGRTFKMILMTTGGLLSVFAGYKLFLKTGDMSEVLSMTGRIPFWNDLLHYNFPKEPFLGYGYMRIDYADKFESINAYAGAMTHNTFLQVLLGLGLAGLLLVIIQMALFSNSTLQIGSAHTRRFIFLLFIPLFINSLTEFGIFGETNFGILFYLMINFYAIQEPGTEDLRIKRHVNSDPRHPGILFRSGNAPEVVRS
jgi:O-antigen ligase